MGPNQQYPKGNDFLSSSLYIDIFDVGLTMQTVTFKGAHPSTYTVGSGYYNWQCELIQLTKKEISTFYPCPLAAGLKKTRGDEGQKGEIHPWSGEY